MACADRVAPLLLATSRLTAFSMECLPTNESTLQRAVFNFNKSNNNFHFSRHCSRFGATLMFSLLTRKEIISHQLSRHFSQFVATFNFEIVNKKKFSGGAKIILPNMKKKEKNCSKFPKMGRKLVESDGHSRRTTIPDSWIIGE